MTELLTANMTETLRLIWEIIVDPAAKPLEALLVFGIVALALGMVLLATLLMITRGPGAEVDDSGADGAAYAVGVEDGVPVHGASGARSRLLPPGVVFGLALAGWWVATAATTASTPVCLTCHEGSPHALSQAEHDPHEGVRCVRCHDGGGPLATFVTAVPSRVEHMVTGMAGDQPSGTYGATSNACASCHESDIDRVTENDAKAVKMSHEEPLDAGAVCLDCHRVSDGVVGVSTTQMRPCLRCHNDSDAPAECSYCHTGDIALAVSGRSEPSTATAQPLVTEIDCGSCHGQESCDSCHGIRLPHTEEFMAYAHAREGVEDLWYNGGRMCGKCHNEESRPCATCHLGTMPSHGTAFRDRHGSGTSAGCDSCHSRLAYRNGRDFCGLCHTASP